MTPIEARTLEIAEAKLDTTAPPESSPAIHRPRLGTGGAFQDVFFWDTAFTVMWAKYFRDRLPVETSLDNLYRLQLPDGLINRQYLPTGLPKWPSEHPVSVAPPILSWAELELQRVAPNVERLKTVYPALVRHHQFIKDSFQAADGLYVSDPLGCGMDNLPRWHRDWTDSFDGLLLREDQMDGNLRNYIEDRVFRWNTQGRWIDTSAQMALDSLCLARIAEQIDRADEAKVHRKEHAALADRINSALWSDNHQFYVDLGYNRQVDRLHIGGFWPLIAEVVPADRLDALCDHIENSKTFGRPTPVPTLSASDPDYRPDGGYWLGASWAPTTYMVLKGLAANGRHGLAKRLADRVTTVVDTVFQETNTLWENYAPDSAASGTPAQPDFCGWSGLFSVAIPREFVDT